MCCEFAPAHPQCVAFPSKKGVTHVIIAACHHPLFCYQMLPCFYTSWHYIIEKNPLVSLVFHCANPYLKLPYSDDDYELSCVCWYAMYSKVKALELIGIGMSCHVRGPKCAITTHDNIYTL